MEVTDLMIGDWVRIKEHLDYDKVREIALDEKMQWYISFACSMTLFRAYEFEPVPITREILEKNGWECKGDYMIKRVGEDTLYWVENLDCGLYKNKYNMCTCKYVHQLQHAFRLCGFDVLADTFKI